MTENSSLSSLSSSSSFLSTSSFCQSTKQIWLSTGLCWPVVTWRRAQENGPNGFLSLSQTKWLHLFSRSKVLVFYKVPWLIRPQKTLWLNPELFNPLWGEFIHISVLYFRRHQLQMQHCFLCKCSHKKIAFRCKSSSGKGENEGK